MDSNLTTPENKGPRSIEQRLDDGDKRFSLIEKSLSDMAQNTAILVAIMEEITAGTKFFCRVAKGVGFLLERWKGLLVTCVFIAWISNHFQLPDWVLHLFRLIWG